MADAKTYPGEFEVLQTKADAGWWDAGQMVLTNHRLQWKPARLSNTPAFEFELSELASVQQVRLPQYLFLSPSLRFTLRDGRVYHIHNPGEDINHLERVVNEYRLRKPYQPGMLFEAEP
jgi:hypothetical protein